MTYVEDNALKAKNENDLLTNKYLEIDSSVHNLHNIMIKLIIAKNQHVPLQSAK